MMVGRVELFPGGISGGEETLYGSGAAGVLVGSGVGKLGWLPVGGW